MQKNYIEENYKNITKWIISMRGGVILAKKCYKITHYRLSIYKTKIWPVVEYYASNTLHQGYLDPVNHIISEAAPNIKSKLDPSIQVFGNLVINTNNNETEIV